MCVCVSWFVCILVCACMWCVFGVWTFVCVCVYNVLVFVYMYLCVFMSM